MSVFVASPGDVQEERERIDAVKNEINDLVSRFSLYLDVQKWETRVRPGAGNRLEDVVLADIEPYDVFIGIMWHRLGTDTGRAPSGTVEEFDIAYRLWAEHQKPRIMFYFKEAPLPQDVLDLDQWRGVTDFRKRLVDQKLLYAVYETPEDFERKVRLHLQKELFSMVAQTQEDPPKKDTAPDEADNLVAEFEAQYADHMDDVLDLRLKLESKMAWLCKHLLAGPETSTYATIGSLQYDGYLSREDARLAARLLASGGHAAGGDGGELKRLAIAAGPLVASFRAIVFDAHVRKQLRTARWDITDLDQPSGPRPDFVVSKDGRSFRIVPRLVTSASSAIRDRAVDRLKRSGGDPPVERRILVIPDRSRGAEDGPSSDPRVVKLRNLESALSDAPAD